MAGDEAQRLLLEKPERIAGFDPGLDERLREFAAGAGDTAVVEVAGRDSIAAAVAAGGSFRALVPTVANTGTEYGDWNAALDNARSLEAHFRETGVRVFDPPVLLGSPRWWHASAGRFAGELSRRYGFCATCVACHMYLHACRAPLARSIGASAVVAGERLLHGGRTKINQLAEPIAAYREALVSAGVTLLTPLERVSEDAEIEALVGDWKESERQSRCVLEANYLGRDGGMELDRGALRRYLDEFLVPLTVKVLAAHLAAESEPEYLGLATAVLAERG